MQEAAHFSRYSLSDLSKKIASGEISPVECVAHSVEMIERHNGRLQAFLSYDADAALAEAKIAEDEIRQKGPRSSVHGIPFGVKDLFAVRGLPRTCGSRTFPAEICAEDAHVVHRLRRAGAIPVGMTSLNEFAYGPTGINAVSASPRNPWDDDRACGGSSSGSGCAVAAGLVPVTLGTDTGGSVRLPAALCGVTGLKPSQGLASRHGIQPLSATFDHPGPLARSAWDCGLILQAIAGCDRNDVTTWNRPEFRMPARPDSYSLKGKRIGVLTSMYQHDLKSEVAAVFDAALGDLKRFGSELSEVDLPGLQAGLDSWNTICLAEAYQVHAERVRDHFDELCPDVSSRLLLGKDISLTAYRQACHQREVFLAEMAGVMESHDLLVAPTTVIPAIHLDTGEYQDESGTVTGSQVLGKLTRLANLTGQPAISVPCGFTTEGLPVGLQIIGRWFEDAALIGSADAYQGETSWHSTFPVLQTEQ